MVICSKLQRIKLSRLWSWGQILVHARLSSFHLVADRLESLQGHRIS